MPLNIVAAPGVIPTVYLDKIKLAKVKWSDDRPAPITTALMAAAQAPEEKKKNA